jgi:hypothetical protein
LLCQVIAALAVAPTVDGVPADIWVFCGQSNSQGWALHKAPVESDSRILFLDADDHPTDPAAIILGVFDNAQLLGRRHAFTEPMQLYHGRGSDPLINIVDERDIPLPAFGPVLLNGAPEDEGSESDGSESP